jgi:hypothetical protein
MKKVITNHDKNVEDGENLKKILEELILQDIFQIYFIERFCKAYFSLESIILNS